MYIHSIDTEIDMIHTDMCIDVDVRCAHRINITVLKLFRIHVYSIGLPFSKIMPKTLHRSKSKSGLPPHTFFLVHSCVYILISIL